MCYCQTNEQLITNQIRIIYLSLSFCYAYEKGAFCIYIYLLKGVLFVFWLHFDNLLDIE